MRQRITFTRRGRMGRNLFGFRNLFGIRMRSLWGDPFTALLLAVLLLAAPAFAADTRTSTLGVSGYDLVSYHDGAKPLRGNGNHVAVHEGVTYLFASEAHRKAFEKEPQRYLPAYGGYCAYGVSVGKKFVGDPDVWDLVDGRLFLNLDNKIKGIWSKDVPGHVRKADQRWASIRDAAPADL